MFLPANDQEKHWRVQVPTEKKISILWWKYDFHVIDFIMTFLTMLNNEHVNIGKEVQEFIVYV